MKNKDWCILRSIELAYFGELRRWVTWLTQERKLTTSSKWLLIWVGVLFVDETGADLHVECTFLTGNQVTGGDIVEVECLVTADTAHSLEGFELDFACSLPPATGAFGSIDAISLTTNPDGLGGPGPNSGGIPFLICGPAGIGGHNLAQCRVFGSSGSACCPVAGGETRYLSTIRYQVSTCAGGDFDVIFENFSNPSNTDFIACGSPPVQIPFSYTLPTLTVVTGSCCIEGGCIGDMNEVCCQQTDPDAQWFEGRSCDDAVPCPDCLSDADCNDGSACNGSESCNPATETCVAGVPLQCDNLSFCDGAEECSPPTGCTAGPPPCSLPLFCDEAGDRCVECFIDAECNDGVACTMDSCNAAAGSCEHAPNDGSCNDALFCNGTETCHPQVGCQAGDPPCAPDLLCDEATDTCTRPPVPTVTGWGLLLLVLALLCGMKLHSIARQRVMS